MKIKILKRKKNTGFRIFILSFILLLVNCSKKLNESENWQIYEFYYKGKDLLFEEKQKIAYSAIPLIIDYNRKQSEFNWRRKKIRFSFDSIVEDGYYKYFKIINSNDRRFIGDFGITIDTIRSSKTNTELFLILESKDIYLKGKRSIFKGI